MKYRTIRNKTTRNFNTVVKYLMDEKHYSVAQAEKIAHMRFETLAANPGGNIWAWLENTIPAEQDETRAEIARIMREIKIAKQTTTNALCRKQLDGNTRAMLENYYDILCSSLAKMVRFSETI